MELISQAWLPLPQPSWPLERLQLYCADVWGAIQAPRAGKGAGGILGCWNHSVQPVSCQGCGPNSFAARQGFGWLQRGGFEQDSRRR